MDYYKTLGVDKNATAEEIKKAYRKKAREFHPDINKSADAETKMKEVNEAYETLSDANKKANYDRFGTANPYGNMGGGGNTYSWSNFGGNGGFDGFSGGGFDFSDIFDIFGGGTATRRTGPQAGSDIQATIQLTFMEAALGAKKTINIQHLETCDTCHGSGAKDGSAPETCKICGGSGQVHQQSRTILGSFSTVAPCQVCRGTGKVIKNPCPTCNGNGVYKKAKKLTVTFPHGINHGETLRVAGEGDSGTLGGGKGDLYLSVRIAPHPLFERKGFDVYYTMPITMFQAVLGGSVEVPTIHGKEKFTIPEGTQTGETFRIKGKGIAHVHGLGKGDLYIKVQVETPKKLSGKEKKQMEELAKNLDGAFERTKAFAKTTV